jgi:hypothetical protein
VLLHQPKTITTNEIWEVFEKTAFDGRKKRFQTFIECRSVLRECPVSWVAIMWGEGRQGELPALFLCPEIDFPASARYLLANTLPKP